ncbi:putative 3-hydroxyacyl-CoA dehydrogenase [Penicillium brasilianum]|uniref:Putative 3-hydroxyacyl-CoA dehydrogenase n=1 Tax=Penicillium brasilianum TaxID=104259 RepID=A0A1S9S079_PENBI|nr:putative 3-hydroxyacyl-CoA dehydrogenase [Penicillium brasilianum]
MPSLSPWTKPDTTTRPIAIIGAGVMGRRVAMMWVAAGYNIILCEKQTKNHDPALEYITANVPLQAAKMDTKPGTTKFTTSMKEAVEKAWMVIEAIPEVLELKTDILGQIDELAPPDCIVTTNSSSLRSSQMLAKTKGNYRICNGHYYMPPEQTYFEVMTCGYTDPDIFPFLMEKAATAGFKPVHAQTESTGLVFNRIWAGIKRECLLALADGVTDGVTIDEMFKSWFQANKGPCKMMDTVGLDTVYNIEVVYSKELQTNPRAKDWLKISYVDQGHLGVKTGKGLLA